MRQYEEGVQPKRQKEQGLPAQDEGVGKTPSELLERTSDTKVQGKKEE